MTRLQRHCRPDPKPTEDRSTQFDQLHDRYQRFLFHVCRQQLNNRDDVQDAVQETCVALFVHFELIQRAKSLPHLLREIAVNKCRDLLRRRRRRTMVALDADPQLAGSLVQVLDPTEEGGEACDRDALRQALQDSVQQLSPRLRTVARLRYIEGLKCLDIATRLGISEGTVKSRLHRARGILRHDRAVLALIEHHAPELVISPNA